MPGGKRRRFQVGLLLVGAAWRLFLVLPVRHWDAAIVSLAIGLWPYGLLAAIAHCMGNRAVYGAAITVVLGLDVAAGIAAMRATSSTGAVAVLVAPIVGAVLVVPLAVTLQLVLKRVRALR
jgi:hypothetical protein